MPLHFNSPRWGWTLKLWWRTRPWTWQTVHSQELQKQKLQHAHVYTLDEDDDINPTCTSLYQAHRHNHAVILYRLSVIHPTPKPTLLSLKVACRTSSLSFHDMNEEGVKKDGKREETGMTKRKNYMEELARQEQNKGKSGCNQAQHK